MSSHVARSIWATLPLRAVRRPFSDNGTDKHFALAMSCGEHTSEDHYKLEVSLSQKWTCFFTFMWHTFSQTIEFFEFFERWALLEHSSSLARLGQTNIDPSGLVIPEECGFFQCFHAKTRKTEMKLKNSLKFFLICYFSLMFHCSMWSFANKVIEFGIMLPCSLHLELSYAFVFEWKAGFSMWLSRSFDDSNRLCQAFCVFWA